MADDENRRETWQHREIVALADAFRKGGTSAAHEAFPERAPENVDRKLRELGFGPTISDTQRKLIDHFVAAVKDGSEPVAVAKETIKLLREVR